jgi:hypothetical protein
VPANTRRDVLQATPELVRVEGQARLLVLLCFPPARGLQVSDARSCRSRYAAFHHVLVLISVFTTVGAMAMVATTLRGRWKMHPRPNQSGGGTMIHRDAAPGEEPASPGNAAKIGFGDAANPGVFGGRAFVPLVEEAGAIQSSALLCAFSFCWWTLFNVFSALHSDQLIQSTPEVRLA